MVSRRTEPFRYTMTPPILCWVEITMIDDTPVSSKLAEAELIDFSKSGCRLRSKLDLHIEDHLLAVVVHMQLNEETYVFPGEIRWQNSQEDDGMFHYGVSLELTAEEKEKINVELRSLAAARKIIVL